ncbi:hypothetical protein CCE01nite_20140 [Cellulomonas cellasea]|uniref:Uncharacterized protein n=1 Tax=Cellulomonas cellasea TaxID=43670 RepID=A0A4Y3KXY1_9CELL|nr:hypothetical protein [Cellulomonas cellasea]GEA88065.1 hypothetical protein CCE01nite_20140 [Cellulomonas cellasea]
MPSYRVTLGVGLLRGSTAPEDVLPAAAGAARALATVEAYDLGVVRGRARITVRFTADDDPAALHVAGAVTRTVTDLATVDGPQVTRRWGSRWYPLRADGRIPRPPVG